MNPQDKPKYAKVLKVLPQLSELFKNAYGRDIRDFVPQCVDEEVKAFLKEAGCIGIDEKDIQLREYFEV